MWGGVGWVGSQNPTMEQGEDASCQPVGANRGLCFNVCWARETYTLTWVWRDYDVTQYGLMNSRSKLPGVCKAATPEASPMSLGFLTAEHEEEEGVKNWSDGGSGGRSHPGTPKAAPEVTKGAALRHRRC